MLLLLSALLLQAPESPEAVQTCPGGFALSAGEPCPFLVFFDSSEAEISRDSSAVLERLLAEWRRGGFTRVRLVGHSDRSGPAVANLRMSRDRAEAIRDWLLAQGMPATALQVQALGERQPIIPTEDGVREPQNRRVEVRLER